MSNYIQYKAGFHDNQKAHQTQLGLLYPLDQFTYTFENFFHPFVGELIQKLNKDSLPGMLSPNFHDELKQNALPLNTFDTDAPNE